MAKRTRSNDETQGELPFDDSTVGTSADPGQGHGAGGGGERKIAHGGGNEPQAVQLHSEAQSRYLNYALSVITSRALPDVRDGLKPVQRRILFTMHQAGITFDAKHRKCAAVVGDVMGRYHPHGDSAIYEALVRMAQSFSLRYPLIDGSGNFGSIDDDPPAAMRYTECRLARIADEMLSELEQDTVQMRPSYDGTRSEPVVLPARIPNLLVNGSSGIAVGMATNIPPHNLVEICDAAVKLLDALLEDKELSSRQLCRWVKGPDFPTGGRIISTAEEIKQMYESGQGTLKIRATWKLGDAKRTTQTIIIDSIPYSVNKSALVMQIGDIALSRKLPPLVDVRDVSTDDVRIELEIKKDADEQMVMAYLFKHCDLQTNFAVNLTCLVPTENAEVGKPDRLGLKEILWHFLHFRLEVVTKRLEHELQQLLRRIHILEGFEKVFDALDQIIKIIRASDGKADAAEKIMARFALDAEQTDAILELKLYRLAKLEILIIQKELEDKRKRAKEIQRLLKTDSERWAMVRSELETVKNTYGDKRRTIIESAEEEPEFSAEDFIVEEDNVVLVTRDGWVKRQKEIKDVSTTRLREGDEVLAVLPGSTRATVGFFSNMGTIYTARIIDVPASTGYGEPIQSMFKFRDGEKVIAAVSFDPRISRDIGQIPVKEEAGEDAAKPVKNGDAEATEQVVVPPTHALAASSDGYALRFSLAPYSLQSTRSGRRYARVSEGAEIVNVEVLHSKPQEIIIAASRLAHAMLCKAEEINFLSGPGKGVMLMKLSDDDRLLGMMVAINDRDTMIVETTLGGEQRINTAKYETVGRGGKGREIIKRGQFVKVRIEKTGDGPTLMDEGENK